MTINAMDMLFDNRLAPLTTSIGFFQQDCTIVSDQFFEWRKRIQENNDFVKKINRRKIKNDFEQILKKLVPLELKGANRYLFVPLKNGWTAFFDNGYRGTDPTVISHLPNLIKCMSIWVVAMPELLKYPSPPTGALIMQVYGYEDTEWLNHIRRIRLEADSGKWQFEEWGKPFEFEQTERYQMRKKIDRFDVPLLKDYLYHFDGLSPFDEEFYISDQKPAELFELSVQKIEGDRQFSLEEARRANYIE